MWNTVGSAVQASKLDVGARMSAIQINNLWSQCQVRSFLPWIVRTNTYPVCVRTCSRATFPCLDSRFPHHWTAVEDGSRGNSWRNRGRFNECLGRQYRQEG